MTIRKFAKRTVRTIFLVLTIPLYLLFIVLAIFRDEDSVFHGFSQSLSLVPGKIGIYLRAAFYHLCCPGTSDDISIGFLTLLSHRDTTIETGVYIGPQCNIGKCSIGENTLIGSGVHILSGSKQHHFEATNVPIQEQGGHFQKVSIGHDCWLGNKSLVMADLANQSIVASASVVIKPSNAGDVLAGNPARFVRNRLITNGCSKHEADWHG